MSPEQKEQSKCTKLKKVAIALIVIAILLMGISFLTPPPYEIHSSVLTAAGIIFGFCSLLFAWEAVDRGIDAKVTHGDTTIELNND